MEIILLEKIRNLGNLGEKVRVKPGYGRNYLLPYQKAVPATPENLKKFEEQRAELEKRAAKALAAAQTRSKDLDGVVVQISMLASEEGKLYGSVGTLEIARALTKAGHEVEKSEIVLSSGVIRETGEFEVDVQLHTDVTATIKIEIIPEK